LDLWSARSDVTNLAGGLWISLYARLTKIAPHSIATHLKNARNVASFVGRKDRYQRSRKMSKVARYGKFVHLEKLLQGTFRATVASSYKDSKLTAAQQDDENRKSSLMPPTTRIGIPSPTGMYYVEPIGRVTRTTEIRRAYYMTAFTFCADAIEPKFVHGFGADASTIRQPSARGFVTLHKSPAGRGLRSSLPRTTSTPRMDILITSLAIHPRCGTRCRGD
jgi:hypothetical protein